MFTVKIQNAQGELMTLTQNESAYQVISVTGIDPPNANINTTKLAGLDGAMFNSAYLNTRNIVVMVRINGDVENNRHELYRFFRTKEGCRFFFANGSRNAYADGYVESVECPIFTASEIMQISIMCPYPYFKSVQDVVVNISDTVAGFVFPFSIEEPIPFSMYIVNRQTDVINSSESDTGGVFTVQAIKNFSKIYIANATTAEYITLNYAFLKDDRIVITTYKGQKSAYLYRNGINTNLFTAIEAGSSFLNFVIGKNLVSYQIDDGANDDAAEVIVSFARLYRGL